MNPLDRLTSLFEKFPGIGPRQARRFVQFLLVEQPGFRTDLAEHIRHLGAQTNQCTKCWRWYSNEEKAGKHLCSMCSNSRRERAVLFVLEKDADIDNVERSGYRGLYFVLGGTIALAAEEPEKYIRMRELLRRIEQDASSLQLNEVILGLSATSEGDHTRKLLQEKILPIAEGLNFKISSLGRGLSTGSELEYADPDTIASALNSRA